MAFTCCFEEFASPLAILLEPCGASNLPTLFEMMSFFIRSYFKGTVLIETKTAAVECCFGCCLNLDFASSKERNEKDVRARSE